MMRDDVFIQDAVGRADTMLTSARAYLFEVMGDFWYTLVSGSEPTHPNCPLHDYAYLRRGRLRRRGAVGVQGRGWHGGLSKGTARPLPA